MIKKNVILFGILSIIFTSCQKEIDWGLNGGSPGGGTSGNLLVKTVSKETVDSVVTVYTYNASKKLINIKITGKSQGTDVGNEERIYRNAAGIIISKTQINAQLVLAGIDSAVTKIYYNTTNSRYTAKVSGLTMFGITVSDSTALVYDAAGKVTEEHTYQAIPILSQPYEMSLKIKYTYDAAGNITKAETYSHDPLTGTDDLAITSTYTYDSKTAANKLTNEAYAIGHADWVAANNATKIEIRSPVAPAADRTITTTYNYNTANRPATGVSTMTPGPIVSNLTFYYQ